MIGWKSWKLTACIISLTPSFFVAQRPSTYSQGNMGKIFFRRQDDNPIIKYDSFIAIANSLFNSWIRSSHEMNRQTHGMQCIMWPTVGELYNTECSVNQKLRVTSSATAERQRVSYTRLSRLTHWSWTHRAPAPHLFYNYTYNRLAKLVSTLSADKPCDMRTLSWIGHSRSFKVILIGAAGIQNGLLS